MVMLEIQQMTTRSKGKQSEWEVQEVLRKATKERVEEANQNNVHRMMQDNAMHHKEQTNQASKSLSVNDQEETWKILADFQISLPLAGLLKPVPRFTEKWRLLWLKKRLNKYRLIIQSAKQWSDNKG